MSPESSPRAAVAFEERQSFRRPVVVGAMGAVLAFVVWSGWWRRRDDGTCPPTRPAATGVAAVAVLWLLAMELHTVVDAGGARVRFRRGVGSHHFAPSDIVSVRTVTYRPVREFGGWGLRFGRGGSRAFNVSGNRGVEIIDRHRRRWVIGSERPDELAAAIGTLGVAAGRGT